MSRSLLTRVHRDCVRHLSDRMSDEQLSAAATDITARSAQLQAMAALWVRADKRRRALRRRQHR